MASPIIQIRRSAVAGKIPTTTQLSLGELAINTYDGKIYIEQDQGAVGVGTTVIVINPWNVGVGSEAYNINFTAGFVGIGTTNPTSKLSVVGDGNFTGIVTASSFNGYQTLLGTASSATKTFTVTVANKTANHRYFGSGSSSGYFIDGAESPFITLLPGKTYRFDQADGSNSSHPLRFYLEANRTTQYTTNVTTNGTAGSAGAYTEITIVDTTPIVLHYQCSNHANMGNAVSNAANFIDTPYQITARSGINATGVVTATTFVGALTGNVTGNATGLSGTPNITVGTVTGNLTGNVTGTATTATNLADAANITTGTINSARLSGTYDINVSFASTAGIATVAQGLTGTPNIVVGVVTATSFVKSGGTSSQFLKADGSIDSNTYLTTLSESDTLNTVTGRGNSTTNGISVGVLTATSGNFSGIITSSGANVSGVVTASSFSGSGSQLTGIVTSIVAGTNITISGSTGQVTINSTASGGGGSSQFVTTAAGIHTLSNVGIGTTNPIAVVSSANTSVLAAGIVTAYKFYGDGSGITGISAVARVTIQSGAPSSPVAGDLWYHSTLARLFVYYDDGDSDQWVDAAPFNLEGGGSGGGASVSVGATAPTGPADGDLWYNSNYGRLFIYYKDGTSDQWVDAAPFNFSVEDTPTKTENSFTATAGQTTFVVTYDVGFVEVYLNGIRLSSSEYTATSGTSVVLAEAAADGDIVDIIEIATGRGSTGAQGPAGPLTGIGTTGTSASHYPVIVSGTGDQDAFITTTSNYFTFIPSSGTLSVNQLNVGVTTLGVTTATNLTVQSLNCSGVATATDFNSTSDINLKDNVKVIDDPLAKVMQINGVSFNWKHTGGSSAGVIAQDVEKVLPGIVYQGSDDYKSLNYNGLIGLLIEAVKEQNETIEILKQKINTLEERLG